MQASPHSSAPDGTPSVPAPQGCSPAAAAQATPAEHASYVFLLDDAGQVLPLPHELYVSLARGEGASAGLAGRTFRLADWYVRMQDGAPQRIVNEWYGWVRFDAQGRFEPAAGHASSPSEAGKVDASALPTLAERSQMEAMLFGAGQALNATD